MKSVTTTPVAGRSVLLLVAVKDEDRVLAHLGILGGRRLGDREIHLALAGAELERPLVARVRRVRDAGDVHRPGEAALVVREARQRTTAAVDHDARHQEAVRRRAEDVPTDSHVRWGR